MLSHLTSDFTMSCDVPGTTQAVSHVDARGCMHKFVICLGIFIAGPRVSFDLEIVNTPEGKNINPGL